MLCGVSLALHHIERVSFQFVDIFWFFFIGIALQMSTQRQKTKFVVRKIPYHIKEEEIKKHLEKFEGKYNFFEYRGQPVVTNRFVSR